MRDIIELHSGSEHHYLKKLSRADGGESKTYVLKLSDFFVKTGIIEGDKFIELTGGPIMKEGSRLEEADAVIKYIDFVMGYGYTLTFE